LRIVFLAVDDEFAGAMQHPVFRRHPDWVVGSVISTCAIYKKSAAGAFFFVLRKSGFRYLAEMARMKLVRRFVAREKPVTPVALAEQHGVEIFRCANINDAASREKVASWRPDLVISTNFSHYIGKKARALCAAGAWNLHKSFLPHYRGMAPSFYALLEGAEHAGATLHYVDKSFDTGDIITQVKVPIDEDESVYSLNRKTSAEGGQMLAEFLESLDLDRVPRRPQPAGDWGYYTYPTPAAVREFLSRGLRF
jgi:folate-dependent phosphoribosylglycinamide formyltransferase PurN